MSTTWRADFLLLSLGSGSDGTVNEGSVLPRCPLWCLMPRNLTNSVDSTVVGKINNSDYLYLQISPGVTGAQVFFNKYTIIQPAWDGSTILGETRVVSPKNPNVCKLHLEWSTRCFSPTLIGKALQNDCTWTHGPDLDYIPSLIATWNVQFHCIIRTHRNNTLPLRLGCLLKQRRKVWLTREFLCFIRVSEICGKVWYSPIQLRLLTP